MNTDDQQSLFHICQRFNLSRLRCYIRLEKPTQLPAFTGSTIHGLLGHALKAADPKLYELFYGEFDNNHAKPYAIVPGNPCHNNTHHTHWHAGLVLQFEIKLFGQTATLAPQLIQALQIGQQLGFGSDRTPYTLLQVKEITPLGEQPLAGGINLGERVKHRQAALTAPKLNTGLDIILQTPLRLKKSGKFNTELPPLHRFLLQIQRRLAELMYYWQDDSKDILPTLEAIEPKQPQHYFDDHTFVQEWSRYSKKDKRDLRFDGLCGSFTLHGDIAALLPWFVIAEQLQIGGKTTFGLGQIALL